MKNLVWDNREIIEERDASNNVTKRYFSQGMMLNGSPYYYTKDHLGSIRELINSTGTVVTRYDYDPYGRRTKISGSVDSDFGYTGDYYHAPSQLCLTLYRAYSPPFGRWLSRDALANAYGYLPIETTLSLFSGYVSTNLYDYVDGNPIKNIDKLGLCPHDCCHAKPLPDSDNACNDYGDDTYAGTSLKCFCRCAGNSRWSQQVRGCLACEHKNQVSPFTAHISCYSYAGWPNAPWTTISLCYGACIGGM
jgi:RHS repeat-associated protein